MRKPAVLVAAAVCALVAIPSCSSEGIPGAAPFQGGAPERLSLFESVAAADLVFEGVVEQVAYRLSDRSAPDEAAIPHTFVTFKVQRAFKGRAPDGGRMTLRFL